MSNIRNAIAQDLINSLDEIAFEERTSDSSKLESIQNILYQYSQIKDAMSIQIEEEQFSEEYHR